MSKINYTETMAHQDKLWKKEKEDLNLMETLFKNIMLEAEVQGFKGVYRIVDGSNEKVIEVFKSKEDRDKAFAGELEDTEYGQFGYCEPLVNYMNKILGEC